MKSKFSKQLKSIRLAKNFSQDALAERLFISRQSISKWENEDATPDLENLIKLADVLEVSLDELVLGNQGVFQPKDDNNNLHLLKDREYVMNPETGRYEKRDGVAIFIMLVSEYWWLIFFLPTIISFIKLLVNLF